MRQQSCLLPNYIILNSIVQDWLVKMDFIAIECRALVFSLSLGKETAKTNNIIKLNDSTF